jgi:hypothetical protein
MWIARVARVVGLLFAVGACGGIKGGDDPHPVGRDPACPSDLPEQFERCPHVGALCEYPARPDTRPNCSVVAACGIDINGPRGLPYWGVQREPNHCSINAPTCPSTFDSRAEGSPCDLPHSEMCDYDEGRCACVGCGPDSMYGTWMCARWDRGAEPGCPTLSPRFGDACDTPGLACNYTRCVSVGSQMQCTDGYWNYGGPDVACDPKCTPKELRAACGANVDCVAPLICAVGHCHGACDTSRDCISGERCVRYASPLAVCLTPDESKCTKTTDCGGSQLCAPDGQCRDACRVNADCIPGEICVAGSCGDPASPDAGAR